MPDALRWFRLELDAKGKVLSCAAVERAGDVGNSVVFIQAVNAKAAQLAAFNAYMREVMRKRRVQLIQEGKCRCGRPNDREPGKRCSRCLVKETGYQKRKRDKAAGKAIPELSRKAAREERRNEERADVIRTAAPSLRLAILQEVHDAWTGTSTNGAFTAWLVREIEAAGGKRRAS